MKCSALKLIGLLALGCSLRDAAGRGWGRRDGLSLPLSTFCNGGGNGPPQLSEKCVHVLDDEELLGRRAATHPIHALMINQNGSVIATEVSRLELASKLRISARDLRVIDPSFPIPYTAILPRDKTVLISLEKLKAIVTAKELILCGPTIPECYKVVEFLNQLVEGAPKDEVFEHLAMEACFKYLCSSKLECLRAMTPRLRNVLVYLRSSGLSRIKNRLDELLPLKIWINDMESTTKDIAKCIMDVLNNEEELRCLYLTAPKSRKLDQHDKVELLLESYLMQVELLSTEVGEYRDEIRNTEEVVEIQLDVLRNRILQFELMLSVSGFVVALGALLTGVFGMNLTSHLEAHPSMFWTVTKGIYSGMLVTILFIGALCKWAGLL